MCPTHGVAFSNSMANSYHNANVVCITFTRKAPNKHPSKASLKNDNNVGLVSNGSFYLKISLVWNSKTNHVFKMHQCKIKTM
jgi:hypothetical protein